VADDCDLYAEGFDRVMSRQDRIDHHSVAVNRSNVAHHVDRSWAAQAFMFSFPVWNLGFLAILKGFATEVFCLASVSFTLREHGSDNPVFITSSVSELFAPTAGGGG
jgi:putative NADPH-quinone reductase